MSAHNFNLRGIPSEVMTHLKREAKRLHMSVNALVLMMIKRGLGIAETPSVYHDIDHLAGTWTLKEAELFQEQLRPFEQIDKELWP